MDEKIIMRKRSEGFLQGFVKWEVKKIKAPRRLNNLFWGVDEAIVAVPGSNLRHIQFIYLIEEKGLYQGISVDWNKS